MNPLSTPITIGKLSLKNCLVMPPMATSNATDSGAVTRRLCDYYDEKSAGGYIGLIVTEHSYVSIEGKAGPGQVSIAQDDDVSGLSSLTEIIHKNGSKVMAQINHAGGAAKKEVTGRDALGASAAEMPKSGVKPREMSAQDIAKVIDDFAAAAVRAKKAGFDAVEIHSAHGYLLNQFYSPLTNKRTDSYSGSTLSGRIKLHLEVIRAIRRAVGADYPIALRLGACDYTAGGTTKEDSVLAAKEFERAGVDFLDISGGFCGFTNPNSNAQGYFAELTEAIKASVSIPVILTGGITDAAAANSLLTDGKADLIGVGRAILKDRQWAARAMMA